MRTIEEMRLEEVVETWNKCKNISTSDFFWLVEHAQAKMTTENKYNILKQKFDYFVSRAVEAWENMIDDV